MAVTYAGTFQAVAALAVGTAAQWAATTIPLPAGVPAFESDTGKLKIGDGTKLYPALPYIIDDVLTTEQKAMLSNPNAAGGVVVLDGNGLVPLDLLPSAVKNKVRFVTDIAARDAVLVADRNGLFVVADASADATVESGAATYGWDAVSATWVKISEFESLDMDFDDFFQISVHTLDDIRDGVNYVRLSVGDKAKLDALDANAVRIGQLYSITSPGPEAFVA